MQRYEKKLDNWGVGVFFYEIFFVGVVKCVGIRVSGFRFQVSGFRFQGVGCGGWMGCEKVRDVHFFFVISIFLCIFAVAK